MIAKHGDIFAGNAVAVLVASGHIVDGRLLFEGGQQRATAFARGAAKAIEAAWYSYTVKKGVWSYGYVDVQEGIGVFQTRLEMNDAEWMAIIKHSAETLRSRAARNKGVEYRILRPEALSMPQCARTAHKYLATLPGNVVLWDHTV